MLNRAARKAEGRSKNCEDVIVTRRSLLEFEEQLDFPDS